MPEHPFAQRRLKVLAYGFHDPQLMPAVQQMVDDQLWDVVRWYGTGAHYNWTEDVSRWHLGNVSGISPQQLIVPAESSEFPKADCDDAATNRAFEIFVDQMSRNPCQIDQPYSSYRRWWQSLLAKFNSELRESKVELLVFQNLPHEGFEWALYWVARRLAIPTLLLFQTVLPNRFCYCWSIEDFGHFSGVESDPLRPSIDWQPGFEKDLFYMQNGPTEARRSDRKPRAALTSASQISRTAMDRWKTAVQRWKRRSGWDRWRGKSDRPINPATDYARNLRMATRPVDWQQRFVYFPLHLQPELTTSAIGDAYRDQLLALERLRIKLNPEIWIYVKENPKQTWRWRGPAFFQRLARIPRTVLVDRATDTYQLLRQCEFAVTVTGTVGWESITGGKPVLVFGRPWYLSLPGVHRFDHSSELPDLSSASVSRDELQRGIASLSAKFPTGVVDSAYRQMLPHFSATENARQISAFFQTIHGQLLTTQQNSELFQ